jgi:pre-mRNA-splicing factor CDC5/CEF1
MRTPQRSQVGDDLLLKAKNLAVLQNAQTPLIGGVNEQLASVSATVNSLATPNPLATPLLSVGTSISESEKLKNARKKLKLSFANIPAPKNEYELLPPEIPSESEKDQIMKPTIEMDAEELAQLNAMKKANEEQVFRSLQSSIVQRGNLPIPSFSVSTIDPLSFGDSSVSQDVVNANEMINDECTRLMIYDIYHQGSVETPEEWDEILKEFRIDEFSRSELDQAKVLILSEASASTDSTITVKEMYQYLVSRDPVITTLPDLDLLTGLQKINSKMYNKIRIKHGGYIARADALQSESFQLESELESLQIDLKCFKELLSNEAAVIEYRLKEWSMLSSKMSNKEHFFS